MMHSTIDRGTQKFIFLYICSLKNGTSISSLLQCCQLFQTAPLILLYTRVSTRTLEKVGISHIISLSECMLNYMSPLVLQTCRCSHEGVDFFFTTIRMCMLQSLSARDKAWKKLRSSNDLHSFRNMVLHSLEGDQSTSRVFHSYAAVDHVMNECSNLFN